MLLMLHFVNDNRLTYITERKKIIVLNLIKVIVDKADGNSLWGAQVVDERKEGGRCFSNGPRNL